MPSGVLDPMKTRWREPAARLDDAVAVRVTAEAVLRKSRRDCLAMADAIVADETGHAPARRSRLTDFATKPRNTIQTQWKLGDAGILAGGGDSRLRFEAEQRQESRNGAQHGSDAGEEAGIGEGGRSEEDTSELQSRTY